MKFRNKTKIRVKTKKEEGGPFGPYAHESSTIRRAIDSAINIDCVAVKSKFEFRKLRGV